MASFPFRRAHPNHGHAALCHPDTRRTSSTVRVSRIFWRMPRALSDKLRLFRRAVPMPIRRNRSRGCANGNDFACPSLAAEKERRAAAAPACRGSVRRRRRRRGRCSPHILNSITSLIGIPVVLWVILRNKKVTGSF